MKARLARNRLRREAATLRSVSDGKCMHWTEIAIRVPSHSIGAILRCAYVTLTQCRFAERDLLDSRDGVAGCCVSWRSNQKVTGRDKLKTRSNSGFP